MPIWSFISYHGERSIIWTGKIQQQREKCGIIPEDTLNTSSTYSLRAIESQPHRATGIYKTAFFSIGIVPSGNRPWVNLLPIAIYASQPCVDNKAYNATLPIQSSRRHRNEGSHIDKSEQIHLDLDWTDIFRFTEHHIVKISDGKITCVWKCVCLHICYIFQAILRVCWMDHMCILIISTCSAWCHNQKKTTHTLSSQTCSW